MVDIARWLEERNLGKFIDAFESNEIDAEALPELTEGDLREMGIPIGPRRKLLKAIRELSTSPPAPASPTSPEPGPNTTSPQERASAAAERRQLTVMFCDLVGSTSLSESMDPEDYRDLLAVYQSAARYAIERYGGYIARYMGDGLLVYFGYPLAHEDDAERAVRAGLDVVEGVSSLSLGPTGGLAVRIGIATGHVVVGDIVGEGASEERAVLGETPNLAARLQGFARPDTVLLSDTTRRLVEGRIALEPLGSHPLKGIRDPVPIHRARAVSRASRFEATAARGLTPMTGRERELDRLWQRWQRARDGHGQVVLLCGEAGIGKSRLSEALRERVGSGVAHVLRYQCSAYHTGSGFHPFVEQLQHAAALRHDDSVEARRRKLASFVRLALPRAETALPMLATLVSVPLDAPPSPGMSPERQRAEIIATLVALIERRAAHGPLLMLFEDAHWIDPSSQEVLDAAIERIRTLPVLCLITHRPEFEPPWTALGHVTRHALSPLAPDTVRRLVERVAGATRVPAAVLSQIVDRTDGVPLFVEELTKTVVESAARDAGKGPDEGVSWSSIPTTLHDSLLARLDRLGPAKRVAQIAACIGREFSHELLASASELSTPVLDEGLRQLVGADLVRRGDTRDVTTYSFKHALVQDAAYQSLLLASRRDVHARIAASLASRFPEVVESEPERVARHFSAAGMDEQAMPHWVAAGRRALAVSSLPEALSHLKRALSSTTSVADAREREERELEVRTVLGTATMALHGWPATEAYDVVQPACALLERGRGDSEAFMNFWNLWLYHGCRAEHAQGLEVVDRMLAHAGKRSEPVPSLIASFTAAMANLWVGEYEAAQRHERTALALYDLDRDRELAWHFFHDPKNTLLSWSALRTWAIGYPERARTRSDDAVAHARHIGHPGNLCWTLGNSSFALAYSGDTAAALARVEELTRIASEQELRFMDAYMAPTQLSYMAIRAGDPAAAYEHGARSESVWRGIGGRFWSPITRACMAEACVHLGRPAEAVALIDETIEEITASGEQMLAAEIHRIAATVHLAGGRDAGRARALLERALAIARHQGTRSFELRAATDLARWLGEQGERQAGVDLLAPVHGWFTEGFETVDLREAGSVLEELA